VRRAPVLLLLAALLGACASEPARRSGPGARPAVRVLLRAASARPNVRIAVAGPYRILEAKTGRRLQEGPRLDTAVVLEGSPLPSARRIETDGSPVHVGGRPYPGALLLVPEKERVLLVNEVRMESYLPGVLAREMGPGFHPAALRAQAVASRTYALDRMRRTAPGRPWHVRDDRSSQVYSGLVPTTVTRIHRAVADTAGMVVTWRSRPVPAYFHSTCGGHTAPGWEIFGGPRLPPLAGTPCPHCRISRLHRWKADFPADEVARALSLPAAPTRVEVCALLEGGRAKTIRFHAPGPVELPAADVRMRLDPGKLYSTLFFRLEIVDGRLVAEGGGWGHGVGMCQMGAAGMARAGASAGDILLRYYPGASLSRVY